MNLESLAGNRVRIRPMQEADLKGDSGWARLSPETLLELYQKSQQDPQRSSFVILNENGERIGRIEYAEYRPSQRRTQCIISLSEDYTGQGYGTDALGVFSSFLFEILEIDAIGLIVDMKNERAIRCYQKCGYEIRHRLPDKGQLIMVLERA